MLIRRKQGEIDIWTPSKINLFLEVDRKRNDGYHDLRTVMMAVSLCDRLRFRPLHENRFTLEIRDFLGKQARSTELPNDDKNLIVAALKRLQVRMGISKGMEVCLWKSIPMQSGLGGGSSDAAAALVGGCIAWNGRYDEALVTSIASELGSDINFFLEGYAGRFWAARCSGRGERIEPISVARPYWFLIAMPPVGCSTASVFRRLEIPEKKYCEQSVIDALASGNLSQLQSGLNNRLEAFAAQESCWIDLVRDCFRKLPANGSFLTGSGSAWVGLFAAEATARSCAAIVRSRLPLATYVAQSWSSPSIERQSQSMNTYVSSGTCLEH